MYLFQSKSLGIILQSWISHKSHQVGVLRLINGTKFYCSEKKDFQKHALTVTRSKLWLRSATRDVTQPSTKRVDQGKASFFFSLRILRLQEPDVSLWLTFPWILLIPHPPLPHSLQGIHGQMVPRPLCLSWLAEHQKICNRDNWISIQTNWCSLARRINRHTDKDNYPCRAHLFLWTSHLVFLGQTDRQTYRQK